MANSSEARRFSPIADTGVEQEEFDVDKFVEQGLKEMSHEEAEEQKYNEWRNKGLNFLYTKALSERHAENLVKLDTDIGIAGRFGENVDKQYIADPESMPGWDEKSPSEQEGIMNFSKLVQERDRLSYEQKYLLQHEKKVLDTLKTQYGLSETDITAALEKYNEAEVDPAELAMLADEISRIIPKKSE